MQNKFPINFCQFWSINAIDTRYLDIHYPNDNSWTKLSLIWLFIASVGCIYKSLSKICHQHPRKLKLFVIHWSTGREALPADKNALCFWVTEDLSGSHAKDAPGCRDFLGFILCSEMTEMFVHFLLPLIFPSKNRFTCLHLHHTTLIMVYKGCRILETTVYF